MIPFVNSIRKEKGILAIDYKETKYGRYQSFSPLSQQLPIYAENFQVYYSVDPTIGQVTVWFNSRISFLSSRRSPSLLWNWSTSTKRWGTPCLWWFGFISYRLLIFRERYKRPGEFSHLDGAATKQGDCFQVLWSLQLEERERKACKKLCLWGLNSINICAKKIGLWYNVQVRCLENIPWVFCFTWTGYERFALWISGKCY